MKQPSQHLQGLLREVSGISASGLSPGSGTESGIIAPQRKGVGSLPLCHLPPVCVLPCSPLRTLLGTAVEPGAGVRSASRLCWDLSACQQTCPTAAVGPGSKCWGSSQSLQVPRAPAAPPIPLVSCGSGVRGQRGIWSDQRAGRQAVSGVKS